MLYSIIKEAPSTSISKGYERDANSLCLKTSRESGLKKS